MLHSMRLRNLRSFSGDESSPFIDLKPLTVLIGKNSSGKSSFLRSLPLLRQSVEAKTSGPILWYGSYVDFGAFSEAKVHDSKIDTIYFDFKVNARISRAEDAFWASTLSFEPASENLITTIDAIVQFGVCESGKKTIPSHLKLIADKFVYEFKFDNDGTCALLINEKEELGFDSLAFMASVNFLPAIGRITKTDKEIRGKKHNFSSFDPNFINKHFSIKLRDFIKKYSHKSISLASLDGCIDKLGVYSESTIKRELLKVFKGNTTFIKNINSMSDEICSVVHELCMHKNLSHVLKGVNNELEAAFKSVKYIAPLRATAERYYRYQDLQIAEIDHTGSNLAMLLRSFSSTDNEKFSFWTRENFGFRVRVEELGLHYALKIQTDNDTREYNINDMGFGFSQMLPIIASIWIETSKNRRTTFSRFSGKRFIFTIEQPELHLHPEYQSRLAKMFSAVVKTAKMNSIDLVILFETHSKTMVDTLGDCIEDGFLDKDDVNIVLFEKEAGENRTKIRFSGFDQVGNLVEWPVGFFSGRL